jgi:hypothetical protein
VNTARISLTVSWMNGLATSAALAPPVPKRGKPVRKHAEQVLARLWPPHSLWLRYSCATAKQP